MKLDRLIAASHSPEAAKVFKAFAPNDADMTTLQHVGEEVLKNYWPETGACALMSAIYAARLHSVSMAPTYVVAGSLSVCGVRVFGDGRPFNGRKLFSESKTSWDGHAWVMFGPYVADVSIFRTAYSTQSPALLARHVRQEFGEGRGLLIVKWSDAPSLGLYYAPEYVLTEEQITGLAKGAAAKTRLAEILNKADGVGAACVLPQTLPQAI